MNARGKEREGRRRLFHAVVAAIAILAMLPLTTAGTAAQGTTTITLTSFAADGLTPLPFVRFQVTDDSTGTIYGPLEAPPGTAQVVFTLDLVNSDATFTIEEETPPPCGIAPDPLTVGPLVEGDNLDVEFATDFEADCDLGGLSAYKYTCPDDFDASTNDYADWMTACTEPVNGATFEFTPDGGDPFQAVTGAYGIAGRAPYTGLVPGDYTIGEVGESATPTVFCLTFGSPNPVEAPDFDTADLMDLTDGVVTVSLNNNRIACDFFYVQDNQNGGDDDGDDDDGGADDDDDTGGADTGSGSIELHLAGCPAGYEPNNDIFDDCHGNGIAGIEFTIDGPNGFSDSAETAIENTPGPGIVRFTGLEEGTYSIGDGIPGDFATTFVYCSLAEAEDQVPFEYNNTDGIDLPLGEDVDVICDWYTIPDPQQGGTGLTITKYTCDASFDPDDASYDDFIDDCPETTEGVTFLITEEGAVEPRSDVTNGNGVATFADLNPTTYQVGEDIPGEFSTPFAFCSIDDGDYFQADTSDGHAYLEIDESIEEINCDWFNVPEDLAANSSITITKYLCPDGQSSNYADACDEVMSDITFAVSGPDDFEASDETNDDGRVAFDGLVAGDYVVTEIPPDDPHVAVYVVSCTEGGAPFDFSYDDSTGLRIKLELDVDEQVRCNWYNVPPKPGPSGSITIEKFLCQGNKDNDYDWENDCESYGAGADFDLLNEDGDVIASGTTNNSGELTFTGLADAAYGLDETSADWCHAEADIVDSKGNVVVEDGGDTAVFIYNCNAKPVSTLPSTGTGSTAVGTLSGSGVWALAGGFGGLLVVFALRWRRLVPVAVRR